MSTAEQTEDLPGTIPGVVERAASEFGDIEALVDGDTRLTFAELADRVDDAARAFIASGVEPGDRVGVWAPNIGEWVIAALGVHRAGGVVVTVNTRFKGSEARYLLKTAETKLLCTVTDFLDTDYVELLGDTTEVPTLEEIIVLRGPNRGDAVSFSDFLARGSSVTPEESAARSAAVTPDDMANILFTSGTTGNPKGAMLGHGATVRAYDAWSLVVGLQEGDRYLMINPYFHSFGLNAGIVASLVRGATMVPHPIFDVPSVMKRVDEEKITMLPGPPAIYMTILDHPELDRYDLSTLRLSVTGSAAVPVEMILRMRSELTFENIVTGYGLTETTGITTMCRHTDAPEIISQTAGRPIPGVEVRLVDADNNEVAQGEPGEVVTRGYNLMKGYYGDTDATAATFDDEGWLHTGDIGVLDPGGNLTITDRVKDMFISGGFNAYPAEIENILLRNPAIGQVAVVGVDDHRMGEVGMAFVILRPDATATADDIKAWAKAEMANYKAPRYVEIVDELPLNASGKVLKFELRDRGNEIVQAAAGG